MIKAPIIEFEQPIGTFYITKLKAKQLIECTVSHRREHGIGIQRALNTKKVKSIKLYCDDPDATFPTPIIIAVDSNKVLLDGEFIEFDETQIIGEIIDGQHRLEGIKNSDKIDLFDMPVIIMFDLTDNEKAYVFSVINSNQTNISKSLIYDLFQLDDKKNVYKAAHNIARALNSDEDSPFYKRLKMLGVKTSNESSLSQGTFVTYLVKLYSNDPDKDNIDIKNNKELIDDCRLPLRKYFIRDDEDVMYKIIRNYFNGVKNVFTEEWENHEDYILSKSTGYGALIKSFPYIFDIGASRKTLNTEFFISIFEIVDKGFKENNIKFTSEYFPSNEQQQRRLSNRINEIISNTY